MARSIRVTTLVENTAGGRGLLAEHGLAFWVDLGPCCILFDTGQGMVLQNNAKKLDIPLHAATAVVLSHGHYDHTGGLIGILETGSQPEVYAHFAAFLPKYARDDNGTVREVGIPLSHTDKSELPAIRIVWTEEPAEICEGVFVTGEIPRTAAFEDVAGQFYNDAQCRRPDPLIDDQALFFESQQGIVVLLGCAHAGVINTLRYVQRLTGGKPLYTVLGGMHLLKASHGQVGNTVEGLRMLDVQRIGPAHCTGMTATAELWNAFPGRCFPCSVGARFEFEVS